MPSICGIVGHDINSTDFPKFPCVKAGKFLQLETSALFTSLQQIKTLKRLIFAL